LREEGREREGGVREEEGVSEEGGRSEEEMVSGRQGKEREREERREGEKEAIISEWSGTVCSPGLSMYFRVNIS
jgi:hypothetical protein